MTVTVTDPTSPHEATARDLATELRTLTQKVGGYAHTTTKHRRRLNTSSTLPIQFLLSVAIALDASPALTSAAGITGAQLREIVNFANAYSPVADEMALVANGLRQTIQSKRGEAGQLALRAYSLAKGFNRPSDRELLVPHIADMKRTLGRGRRKTNAPAPAPPAPSAPEKE